MHSAWTMLLYPPVLVGRSLHGAEALAVLPSLIVATGALAAAFWSVQRHDIPLEAAQ